MNRRTFLIRTSTGAVLACCGGLVAAGNLFAESNVQIKVWSASRKDYIMTGKISKTEQEWRELLTPEQFEVTRKHGTERAFSGEYDKHAESGAYQCVCCGQDLFHSGHKYDSGSGWPSFYQAIAPENIGLSKDRSWLMVRNEVHCSRCQAHLGHVFEDGPQPSGLRYCINSVALKFAKG